MGKKIALIKVGSFSHINKSVYDILTLHFPDSRIVTIDIWDIIKSKKTYFIGNILAILKEYGTDFILNNKKVEDCIFITPYLFRKVKKIVASIVNPEEFLFSIQTQSLFDGSTPGVPHFVYTDHTFLLNLDYPGYTEKQLPSTRWLELEKSIYSRAALNFTMSAHTTGSIVNQYGCDPVKVKCIWAGSNVPVNSLMSEKRDYTKRNILFVGIKWERKGGPELFEAFKRVLEVYPDTSLTVVGCNPDIQHPNCNIVGSVPIEEMGKYYAEASVFCLPTRLEPFGIVFTEALMYSLPVVTTNLGAIPDFIEDGVNGFLVQPQNVDQLYEALIAILESSETRQRFGEKGHSKFTERYRWEKVGEKMKEHISKVLARTAASPSSVPFEKNSSEAHVVLNGR